MFHTDFHVWRYSSKAKVERVGMVKGVERVEVARVKGAEVKKRFGHAGFLGAGGAGHTGAVRAGLLHRPARAAATGTPAYLAWCVLTQYPPMHDL